MLKILEVTPGSIADELGLGPGDCLVAINGEPVRDLIDYRLQMGSEELLLEIERTDGELWELELDKDADEDLGLQLPHPEPDQCGNNCLFCFVHQLPRGLRPTLYVKDEDYRFSYLYGAYVTLTNIDEAALERILTQRLSPLYVSVHATSEELRSRLLGRQGPSILDVLQRLTAGGIAIHTQVVLCPGINDGAALDSTFRDLVALAPVATADEAFRQPGIHSLALVPVGLTGYRQRLPELRSITATEARTLLAWVHARQDECLLRLGTRFVFAADELYLTAGMDFPPLADYESLPQIENGVGLVAQFRAQAQEVLDQARPLVLPPVTIVTGESAAGELKAFVQALTERTGAPVSVAVVVNRFFGGAVTVTGLLTGSDIVAQLAGQVGGRVLILPEVVLREGTSTLLDDLTIAEIERQLQVRVEVCPADPWGVWDILETLALERQGDDHA